MPTPARRFRFLFFGLFFEAWLAATFALAVRAEGAADYYSPGGWATLHQGPDNRKLVASAPLAGDYRSWTALAGASILTAPTLSPDGRTLYVTTGQSKGHANLHAFDLSGRVLWQAAPWQNAEEGVDPCAILSSPIVDRKGDVYVADCNQLFAFHGTGEVKWIAALPLPQKGDWRPSKKLPINSLTTAAFTRGGNVFGVTNFGDIVVFDRATGAQLNRALRFPGAMPRPSPTSRPRAVFADGLVDPEIRDWAWQLLMGGRMRSANTPAVDRASGRIFVAATSTAQGRGTLYALDLIERDKGFATGEWRDGITSDYEGPEVKVTLGFAADMGPGSGSSPALSPEGDRVYVSDELGRLYGVDARTGGIHWVVETKAASAAAAVAANGDVIALQVGDAALISVSRGGEVRWQSDLSALTQAALPRGRLLGKPIAIGNGNPTVVGNEILVPIAYGYAARLGRRVPLPVRSFLVAVDAATGRGLRNVVSLPDDSSGITAVLPDGTILSSLGAAMTSGVSPLAGLARLLLPGKLELLAAVGGLQVSRPTAPPAP